jgi:hypothetical protein
MGNMPLLIFLMASAAFLGAYGLGMFERARPNEEVQLKKEPAEVVLEYRNATGFKTLRKIRILGYVQRRAGRSCIFALCNNGTVPRMFRIDRIVSIATLDGEVRNTKQFLTEILGVPV